MGFTQGDFPPVDLETFTDKPLMERMRALATHWAEYGFGTPRQVHVVYLAKLLVLYILAGTAVATLTSGLTWWDVASWWREPVVYEKAILWTVLLESIGVGGSWGPLAGKFKPMTGGILWWTRPGTIRLPPWPGKVPGTAGDTRTVGDVALYVLYLAAVVNALVFPLHHVSGEVGKHGLVRPTVLVPVMVLIVALGLRDKIIFIAARSEQYWPAMFFMAVLNPVDMIIAFKLLIVVVWMGAGVSKFGRHFTQVVAPMVSNTPFYVPKWVKRRHYRDFPNDLRPSHTASMMAHAGGTAVEIITPLVLLFSTNWYLTAAAVALMVAFHLFITSTFPLAVPLEWNILFAYASVFLFLGHRAGAGYAVGDMSHWWITVLIVAALLVFPIWGNLRPDLISFLPSMRQYAGNWASAMWAFAPGMESRLNERITKPARNQVDQLGELYPWPINEITMQQTIAWRSMHSQGRGLFSLMMRHLGPNLDTWTLREAEFLCNSVVAFNFGDGHLHNRHFINAVQRRCQFAPGEVLVVWIESQPINKPYQEYQVYDLGVGVIERGRYLVKDAVEQQPWLPNGPIPTEVTWTRTVEAEQPAPLPAPATPTPTPAT